jgi:hypothetical protein
MDKKIRAMIILSFLVFALIIGIPAAFVSISAQGEGGNTGGMPGGEGMTGGGGMSADTSEMQADEGITVGGEISEEDDGITESLENETNGMTEGQTDPNGEGEVDLGTGGP